MAAVLCSSTTLWMLPVGDTACVLQFMPAVKNMFVMCHSQPLFYKEQSRIINDTGIIFRCFNYVRYNVVDIIQPSNKFG